MQDRGPVSPDGVQPSVVEVHNSLFWTTALMKRSSPVSIRTPDDCCTAFGGSVVAVMATSMVDSWTPLGLPGPPRPSIGSPVQAQSRASGSPAGPLLRFSAMNAGRPGPRFWAGTTANVVVAGGT